jgi:hypothetical protein
MTNEKQNGTYGSDALEAKPKRRKGRGKLVFFGRGPDNPGSAEVNPEATRSTDQTLTEISLKNANSDSNAAILREREKAADRCEHIMSGLPAKQKAVLTKVLEVVEPSDSLHEIARKAGLHAPQVSRAFKAAQEVDKRRIFSKRQGRRKPAYKPYNPRCVPMEIVMMPHQGCMLYTIAAPTRPTGTVSPVNEMTSPETPMALDLSAVQSESQSAQTENPAASSPEPQSQAVPGLSDPDTRSLPSSPGVESKFDKLKQLFSSCFQWVRAKLTAFRGLKHPVYRDESIRAKSPGT